MSNKDGTTVSLFVLMHYCEQCSCCRRLDNHDYQDKSFVVWQCDGSARTNLVARLKDNRAQYVYTDDSAAFTFLNHNCPHFVMVSMESEENPVMIGIDSATKMINGMQLT